MTNQEILESWYRYSAERPGSMDTLLRILRERTQQTEEEQQEEFGVSDEQWVRLKGFRLPRERLFVGDAQRIAEVCQLRNPFAFIQALRLARTLESSPSTKTGQFYRAAFDASDDLDKLPDDESQQ